MKKIPKILLLLLGLLMILLGVFVFLYPVVSTYEAQKNQIEVVEAYESQIVQVEDGETEKMFREARQYNQALAGDPVQDPFILGSGYVLPDNYEQLLNPNGDGIMGYLEIPKLGVRLPIGHGSGKEVLEKNVGHIEATALPVGGAGNHAVLTGHRGLPSAELLTRLDEMEIGDLFYLRILDQVLAYRVDQITTVLPHELENLRPEQGKDLVTVLTCTPYGVNTHRLLVRGERTEYIPEEREAVAAQSTAFAGMNIRRLIQGTVLGFLLLVILLAVVLLVRILKISRKKGKYCK